MSAPLSGLQYLGVVVLATDGRVGVVVDGWASDGTGDSLEVKVAWEPLRSLETSVVRPDEVTALLPLKEIR